MKTEDIDKFQGNLLRLIEESLNATNTERGSVDLEATLSKRVNEGTDIEKLIEEFQGMLKAACDKSFRKKGPERKQ